MAGHLAVAAARGEVEGHGRTEAYQRRSRAWALPSPVDPRYALSAMKLNELEETNRQFIDAWTVFARCSAASEAGELRGLAFAFSRVSMPLLNMVFFSSPVADAADLERRVKDACARGDDCGYPWILMASEEWIAPVGEEEAGAIFKGAGLERGMQVTGMVTDALLPPRRQLPALEMRPIKDHETRTAMADINCRAYGMPIEWGREALTRESMFQEGTFGVVGYLDGAPVATATTVLLDGRLYVELVATEAAHRSKGYAEAVMRSSLANAARESALSRTVLHATDAGYPLYLEMGYRPTGKFIALSQPGAP